MWAFVLEKEGQIDEQFQRAQQRREQARAARRERVANGKADEYDRTDPEDIVCPYCGAWESGVDLPPRYLRETGNFTAECSSCHQRFGCRIEVKHQFTTFVPEETDGSR